MQPSCDIKGGGHEMAEMILMTIHFNSAAIIKIYYHQHHWLPLLILQLFYPSF